MTSNDLFTSETVLPGHPDKMADQISDAILDAYLDQDPQSKVAAETFLTADGVFIGGEITSDAEVDIKSIVSRVIEDIGYNADSYLGANPANQNVLIVPQSSEIRGGVLSSLEARDGDLDPYDQLGAGDQGIMFGYATDETESGLPLAYDLANTLARSLVRELPEYGPDGKVQITTQGNGSDKSRTIHTVLVSIRHDNSIEELRTQVEAIIESSLGDRLTEDTRIFVNPAGEWRLGGPVSDTGLTGRKIIVDTYGGGARHGGGAFSGKDPSKVDRSGAYAARQAALLLVRNGMAKRAEVQIAYGIGVAHPISVRVDTFGTNLSSRSDGALADLVTKTYDLRPAAIIERLDLLRPIYRKTASFGHFGVSDRSWEQALEL